MHAGPEQPAEPPAEGPSIRFEAIVHAPGERVSLQRVMDLDLDRVPDPEGAVRLLITAQDAAELLAQGFEVRLVKALDVRPLDPGLALGDDSAQAWLENEIRGIDREGGA